MAVNFLKFTAKSAILCLLDQLSEVTNFDTSGTILQPDMNLMIPSSNYFAMFQIDTTFNMWVLPFSRDKHALQLPEMGGDDPSLSP